jgi:hypothetical protein
MQASPGKKSSTNIKKSLIESDKPIDMYYLIDINCKYKRRIHELLKELRLIN